MRMIRWGLLAVCVLFLQQSSRVEAAYAATAHLVLKGQPGNFILNGATNDVTYNNFTYGANTAQINGTLANGVPDYISFVLNDPTSTANTFATLDFSTAQLGIALVPGTYTNAQRAPFAAAGHAGLDVGYQNRGSNTLTGSFTINSISFFNDTINGGGLTIGSFSASFTQYSDSNPNALTGTFTYQNLSPLAGVPEPSSLVLLGTGLVGLGYFGRRRVVAAR